MGWWHRQNETTTTEKKKTTKSLSKNQKNEIYNIKAV